ncbi:Rab family GTPase [Herpetosiphon geysericola]|uniref:GTPase n=1 Tax=Herpetosiphon geysericola TaxID=70996 RepID=A0A0P6YJY2_9CHLR|nr:GTPase domain-containing protein [Herpetosiphon geysericola]KPL90926.1 hypothetical protein SE18_03885 [Herpetosiphon geysericola]
MIRRRIAVCGAPVVGKTTLLSAFCEHSATDEFYAKSSETERLVWMTNRNADSARTLMAASGSVLAANNLLPWLMRNVHAIVYVIGAIEPNFEATYGLGAVQAECERQQHFWNLYTSHALAVGSRWSQIPWVFVLNKIDLGSYNPLLEYIPTDLASQIYLCSAVTKQGLAQLWDRILEL